MGTFVKLSSSVVIHVFYYKHDVYKHIQDKVWRFFNHMLSIMLSLAKHYYVKRFSGQHELFHTDYDFFLLRIAKHFPSDSSKIQQNKWRSLEARWPITLQSVSQQQHILYNNFSSIIIFRARLSLFRKHMPSKILMNKHNASIL